MVLTTEQKADQIRSYGEQEKLVMKHKKELVILIEETLAKEGKLIAIDTQTQIRDKINTLNAENTKRRDIYNKQEHVNSNIAKVEIKKVLGSKSKSLKKVGMKQVLNSLKEDSKKEGVIHSLVDVRVTEAIAKMESRNTKVKSQVATLESKISDDAAAVEREKLQDAEREEMAKRAKADAQEGGGTTKKKLRLRKPELQQKEVDEYGQVIDDGLKTPPISEADYTQSKIEQNNKQQKALEDAESVKLVELAMIDARRKIERQGLRKKRDLPISEDDTQSKIEQNNKQQKALEDAESVKLVELAMIDARRKIERQGLRKKRDVPITAVDPTAGFGLGSEGVNSQAELDPNGRVVVTNFQPGSEATAPEDKTDSTAEILPANIADVRDSELARAGGGNTNDINEQRLREAQQSRNPDYPPRFQPDDERRRPRSQQPPPPMQPPMQPPPIPDADPVMRPTQDQTAFVNVLEPDRSQLPTSSADLFKSDTKTSEGKSISELKDYIKYIHAIYDKFIPSLQTPEHKKNRDIALKSDKIEVVRRHYDEMEDAVRKFYQDQTNIKLGVVISADAYIRNYMQNMQMPAQPAPIPATPAQPAMPAQPANSANPAIKETEESYQDSSGKIYYRKTGDPYDYKLTQEQHLAVQGGMLRAKRIGSGKPLNSYPLKTGIGFIKDPVLRSDNRTGYNQYLNSTVIKRFKPQFHIK